MPEKLRFKVSSALKNIVGKDLITDEFIAVFEIVKNSYDAFARNVLITIEQDKLTIADDGKGMSLDDIKNKWLFLAYSAKNDNTEDENKHESYRDIIQSRRHYAGAKGIGRFSSDRLGAFLTLKTSKKDNDKIEIIEIDWNKFEENQNDIFQLIDVDYKTVSKNEIKFPKKSDHGTILEITQLNNSWDRKRIQSLKHSLEKLINPFSESNDFNIEIVCDQEKYEDNNIDQYGDKKHVDRDRVNGIIKNSILDVLNIKTTQISVQINKETIDTKIIDRGTLIYHITEDNQDFQLLTDFKIDLFYLNRSAKVNFTKTMGMHAVNYGSVFLFKNGFRIQPFGEFRDDSWDIDRIVQQGYGRHLGTRQLFGRVEVLSDNATEFKEVSSRDGGLIETEGSKQILNAFTEKGLKRLERYVVGVLWGEGFRRNKYFGTDGHATLEAEKHRKDLSENDSVSDNISSATSNLGSKLDFIQIIKSLSSNKKIEIIDFNKDFINLINDKLETVESKFISDLNSIADKLEDSDLKDEVIKTEAKYHELLKAKEDVEKKAIYEEKKKKEAEEKARIAEDKRQEAEEAKLKAENERLQAENAQFKAEEKAKKEKEDKDKALLRVDVVTDAYKEEKKRGLFLTTLQDRDKETLENFMHQIKTYSGANKQKVKNIIKKINKGRYKTPEDLIPDITNFLENMEKILETAKFATVADFRLSSGKITSDVTTFIDNYLTTVVPEYQDGIRIIPPMTDEVFELTFSPIEFGIILDNLVSNSLKINASEIKFTAIIKDNIYELHVTDTGTGLDLSVLEHERIFEKGFSRTSGSGLGLYFCRKIINNMGGTIEFDSTTKHKGFSLIIRIKKK